MKSEGAPVPPGRVRLEPELLHRLAEFGAATLHEAAGGDGALCPAIRSLTDHPVVGLVVTVHCAPGDNLALHHALEVAGSGDVIVCTTGGAGDHGYWGEVMTVAAIARGVAGLVIDGGVRDLERLRTLRFPVFARHACMRGTTKQGPGKINEPMIIGQVLVCPGDVIVGDLDGVLALAAEKAPGVYDAALQRRAKERWLVDELQRGRTTVELLNLPR